MLYLFLLLTSLCIHAQSEKLLSPKQMQKDFAELYEVIGAHPDPYTHITEEQFLDLFEQNEFSLNQNMTYLDYYKKVAAIVALIRDGHSSVQMPAGWLYKKRRKHGVFPFEVYLNNNDELFITKNFSAIDIPTPAKVLSLNGISIDSFLIRIDPYISYERKNFRNTLIDDELEFYLYLAFGQSNNTQIEYSSAATETIEVENITLKEWSRFQKENREIREAKISKGEPYQYIKMENGVGLIKVFAFLAKDLENYERFLRKTFKSIQSDSIHSLIIDVRGNYGGWAQDSFKPFSLHQ